MIRMPPITVLRFCFHRLSVRPPFLSLVRGPLKYSVQTIYVKLSDGKTVADAKVALEKAYADERFVTVLPGAAVPHTRHVRGR